MEKYDYRQLTAASVEDSRKSTYNPWPLSSIPRNRIAYKLYYFLLSESAQDHLTKRAYVSDRYWKKKDAAKLFDCDPRSITNNLKTLQSKGIITRDESRRAYIFNEPPLSANIPKQVIKTLLDLDGTIDAVLAIRILSVVCFAAQHKMVKFTTTDIKWALRNYDINGDFIRLCLSWWESIKLLDLEVKPEYNEKYGHYNVYTVKQINWDAPQLNDGPLSNDFKNQFASIV